MGSHKTVTKTGRNIDRVETECENGYCYNITCMHGLCDVLNYLIILNQICYTVAFQMWMHDYIDCTSFKFTSAASQKFIPKQVGGYT